MPNEAQIKLSKLSERIDQVRGELEVQLHLGVAEAKDEWKKIEPQLNQFKSQSKEVADAAGEVAEDVVAAASMTGDEILKGYEKIRSLRFSVI